MAGFIGTFSQKFTVKIFLPQNGTYIGKYLLHIWCALFVLIQQRRQKARFFTAFMPFLTRWLYEPGKFLPHFTFLAN